MLPCRRLLRVCVCVCDDGWFNQCILLINRFVACGQCVLRLPFCVLYGLKRRMLTVCIIHGGVDPRFFSGCLFLELCGKTQPPASWDGNRDRLFIEKLLHCNLKAMLLFLEALSLSHAFKRFSHQICSFWEILDIGINQPPAMLAGNKFECIAYCFDYCHTFIFFRNMELRLSTMLSQMQNTA
ncbi:unnamed protein product [Arctogadus glacialis]